MIRTTVSLLALCLWGGSADAQFACRSGVPIIRSEFTAELAVDGLAINVKPNLLAVWPEDSTPELNAELGVWIEFTDGRVCRSAITQELAHGAAIAISTRQISAVEVGLCDTQRGFCLPVRVSLTK